MLSKVHEIFFQKILVYLEKTVFLWVKIGLKHYY